MKSFFKSKINISRIQKKSLKNLDMQFQVMMMMIIYLKLVVHPFVLFLHILNSERCL